MFKYRRILTLTLYQKCSDVEAENKHSENVY